jgi:hypothetical protein
MNDEINLPATSSDPSNFIKAYLDADDDTDIEMRAARSENEPAVVLIHIGKTPFALPTRIVRKVADFLESQMRLFHGAPEVAGFPDMVMSMRACADKVDELACAIEGESGD